MHADSTGLELANVFFFGTFGSICLFGDCQAWAVLEAVLLPTAVPVHGDVDGDLAGRILRLILAAGQRVLYHPANCHIDLNVSASRY